MKDDFWTMSIKRYRDADGEEGITIRIGWGVIWLTAAVFWLAAAVFSILVMMP